MTEIVFLTSEGRRLEVEAERGRSVMEVARAHDLVEGACDGSLACATCHVIFEPEIFRSLPPIEPEEDDMLDFAVGIAPTSRLGCQVTVDQLPDGCIVRVPPP